MDRNLQGEVMTQGDLLTWVLEHAQAGNRKLYFRINGDIPLNDGKGTVLFFEILQPGRRVVVLHPKHLTPVAIICYEYGIEMIQA